MNNYFKMSLINVAFLTLFVIAIVCLLLIRHVGISWTLIALAGCASVYQLWKQTRYWWKNQKSRVATRERILRVLASIMAFFLTTGTALYLCAFQCEGNEPVHDGSKYLFVNAEYFLRSVVCSLDLFMLDIDSNVLDTIKGHYYLKGLISIQAVFSFSCTVALLISLAIVRVKAYRKLHWKTVIDNAHNHLYIFFDITEAALLLAKSIRDKEKERAVIVFVGKTPVKNDDRGGWDSIVDMFTQGEQVFSDADDIDARLTFSETRLCEIDIEKFAEEKNSINNVSGHDVLGETNLRMVQTLINRLSTGVAGAELHVFFLSDNDDDNIRAASTLSQDVTINNCAGTVKERFYCHARHSGLNRVIEDVAVKRGVEVKIIDSAHLSIELLKVDAQNHPVMLMDIDRDNPTTVKSALHALIIGFDEAGQDAFRFLYEFGAFVDSDATPLCEKRSPFFCTILDKRIQELEGSFYAFSPAVMHKKAIDNIFIDMKECDCQSKEFYDILTKKFMTDLNYVVISVGSDELGMTCAIRLFNYIRLCREDLSKLRIYVRSYKKDKQDYSMKIANHYNEGYNNDRKKTLKGKLRDNYVPQDIIIPFGQQELIYSYDMIVGERLVMEGKAFMEGYNRMRSETETWESRRRKIFGDISLDGIRSLRRKELQDIANALHAGTKLYLLKSALDRQYDWHFFIERYFNGDGQTPHRVGRGNNIIYPGLDESENKAILNLARLEHLRWNASHEILGYRKAHDELHGCDERLREHNCLRPWNELDAESAKVKEIENWDCDYKSYDFGIVDISLLLYRDKLLQ